MPNNDGQTPLHVAAETGHGKGLGELLDQGANVHAEDKLKSTPLHYAADNGHVDIVRALLEGGAQ